MSIRVTAFVVDVKQFVLLSKSTPNSALIYFCMHKGVQMKEKKAVIYTKHKKEILNKEQSKDHHNNITRVVAFV